MTTVALVASLIVLVVNAMLRAAGASLVRTPRANAVHDAAEGNRRAGVVAELLDDRPRIQPALGIFHAGLMVLSAIPATWALASLMSGAQLLGSLVVLAVVLVVVGDVMPRGIGRARTHSSSPAWVRARRPPRETCTPSGPRCRKHPSSSVRAPHRRTRPPFWKQRPD